MNNQLHPLFQQILSDFAARGIKTNTEPLYADDEEELAQRRADDEQDRKFQERRDRNLED